MITGRTHHVMMYYLWVYTATDIENDSPQGQRGVPAANAGGGGYARPQPSLRHRGEIPFKLDALIPASI